MALGNIWPPRGFSILAAVGLASISIVPAGPTREAAIRHIRNRHHGSAGSIAAGNRWGGEHKHAREIARRQRQARRATA